MPRLDDAPKRPTNLSLDSKVLDLARELGMNLSQTVDALLAAEVQRRYLERWNEDNKAAVEAYNARIEREGTFSQRLQRYLAERGPDDNGAERLNPELTIERTAVFADTANLGVFPSRLLRRPVANLREHRVDIDGALHFLFAGIR